MKRKVLVQPDFSTGEKLTTMSNHTQKFNLRWLPDLTATAKLLKKFIGEYFLSLEEAKIFLDRIKNITEHNHNAGKLGPIRENFVV